eukprot:7169859-Prymnesium_polylepis.1
MSWWDIDWSSPTPWSRPLTFVQPGRRDGCVLQQPDEQPARASGHAAGLPLDCVCADCVPARDVDAREGARLPALLYRVELHRARGVLCLRHRAVLPAHVPERSVAALAVGVAPRCCRDSPPAARD